MHVVDFSKPVDVLLFLPSSPDKINFVKTFTSSLLPPVSLLQDALDHCRVVSKANPKFICPTDRRLSGSLYLTACCLCVLSNFLLLTGHIVGIENCLIKLLVHFDFQIQYELSRVKKLTHV
jgi:hypothetical protein